MRNATVAERVEVRKCEAHAVGMVGAHERGPRSRAPDVDADERHRPRREVRDQVVVGVDADQDRSVETVFEARALGRE